ncbi:unnamed protein product [Pseudo-nitzschia multistriata]|uniref:Uncharacterized protein n=1 Tax=Pseudo-nitzschia multistriata TaxID=183589 RepID=A0A448YW48_9STRA|nr:unnamed protein product [Pseudo-nitzschia multistriata]
MASSDGVLRASEFAATLNGDNHQAILKVLREFARAVRREREIALSLSDDSVGGSDDDDWSDDEMEDACTDEPPAKKLKKSEEWKADTAAYHVPFVGTAIARGERAEVVKGEWPTGLVKAYLERSPLALELLNDDLAPDGQIHRGLLKKKKSKLSRAISKAHQLAIAELLTVAIPMPKLQEVDSDGTEDHIVGSNPSVSFLQGFTKRHLPQVFNVLNEETERGRGKPGTVGGCDLLVAPALKVLKHYSMISTSNARLVARYLDESLLEGVLRVCLRPLQANKETKSISKAPRTEAILLATSLLQAQDAAVNTYICTGGNKERKVKPGILFLALREGLAVSSVVKTNDEKYMDAAIDMLEKVRVSLFSRASVTNARLRFNLMARDPLQHLCRLSLHAPPLAKNSSFVQVLDAKDNEDDELESSLEDLGVEARRLLFPLLSDSVVSPFLPNFGADQIARSMIRLLESQKAGVELRRFLLYCTKQNPTLITELFTMLAMPDAKNSFAFVSRASFITLLLSQGPSARICLSSKIGGRPILVDDVLPVLFPMKLKGQFFAKSLNNGNHLVRLECFKMIIVILNRFQSLREEGTTMYKWDKRFIERLREATFQWLPDLQILLSLRSRFDGISSYKCGAILSDHLFRIIEDT